jgi:hypothetical protein
MIDDDILNGVAHERLRQIAKWGDRIALDGTSLPDGTGLSNVDYWEAEWAKQDVEISTNNEELTWRLILTEEVLEAFAESDLDKLERELIQVSAVAVAWIRDIRSRKNIA